MNVKKIIVGPIETNCYLVREQNNQEVLIIDPGGEGGVIADTCNEWGLHPCMVVNTHAHFDHIAGNSYLKKHFPGLCFATGIHDADSIIDPEKNLGAGFGVTETVPETDRSLQDGDVLEAAGCQFRIMHTPGHTKGSISLISESGLPEAVFCGDLLFAQGVGRTDLPGGDASQLKDSIRALLAECDDRTQLYPGHGPDISAGERKQNSFEGYL